MALSLEQGKVVQTETALTFADGIATRVPNPQALQVMQAGLARVVRVTDDEIADSLRLLFRTTHNVAEGAGAAATAAWHQDVRAGRVSGSSPSAVIMTGGNIDQSMFAAILAGATPVVAP